VVHLFDQEMAQAPHMGQPLHYWDGGPGPLLAAAQIQRLGNRTRTNAGCNHDRLFYIDSAKKMSGAVTASASPRSRRRLAQAARCACTGPKPCTTASPLLPASIVRPRGTATRLKANSSTALRTCFSQLVARTDFSTTLASGTRTGEPRANSADSWKIETPSNRRNPQGLSLGISPPPA